MAFVLFLDLPLLGLQVQDSPSLKQQITFQILLWRNLAVPIHSKSEKVCGTAFSVKKNAEKVLKFWAILGHFWAILDHIGSFWAILGHLGSYLGHFVPF